MKATFRGLWFTVFSLGLALSACLKQGTPEKTPSQVTQQRASGGQQPTDDNSGVALHYESPCQRCHEEDRPATPHVAQGDCVSCHAYPEWQSVAQFSHEPTPESCVSCHEKDRPAAPHDQNGDCVSCHQYPSFMEGITFSHMPKPENCEQCHARPATGQRSYPNQGPPANFVDGDPGSEHYTGKDCLSCHATPAEGASAFGFSHSSPNPQACLPCHFNEAMAEHVNDNDVTMTGFGNCFDCHTNYDQNNARNFEPVGGDD
jgi:cytochrome c5